MKKLFLTVMGLLFAVTLTFAQQIDPAAKAKEKVALLTQELTLTEEQQVSIHEVVLQGIQSKEAIKADASLADDVKATQLEAIKAEQFEKVNALLTDEQKVKFAELKAKKEEKKVVE